MNIFKINFNNNDCLILPNNDTTATIKKIGPNVFFYKENKVVGFNIFDFKLLKHIRKNGRLLINKSLIDLIQKTYNIKLKISRSELGYFVVGLVKECQPIIGTHLSLCKVNVGGSEDLQIVCGAKNVRANLKVVVATIGVMMNSGLIIKPSKLQGLDSNGMLCSQKELNLESFNGEGIIELNDDYQVGDVFRHCYQYEFE